MVSPLPRQAFALLVTGAAVGVCGWCGSWVSSEEVELYASSLSLARCLSRRVARTSDPGVRVRDFMVANKDKEMTLLPYHPI